MRKPFRAALCRGIVAAQEQRHDGSRNQRQEGDDREKLLCHGPSRPLTWRRR
jgi:hypothetical protein